MSKEIITLHAPGALPGIPGESHGPGVFLVDYEARTIEEVTVPTRFAIVTPRFMVDLDEVKPPEAQTEAPST